MKLKRVYLDYASATPVDSRAFKEMKPFFSANFGNPLSLHDEGLKIKKVIDDSRTVVARIFGAKKEEVIFTSGGTEANNLAILGFLKTLSKNKKHKIITTTVEHSAVLKAVESLGAENFEIIKIGLNQKGELKIDELEKQIDEDVVLISVMYVNNEVGTIFPLREISSIVKKFKNKIGRGYHEFPYIHADASQAPNYLDINMDRLGVQMISIDGSKIYGPKGSGALIKKFYISVENIIFGGGQEFGIRPGTQNVPAIVGFAHALKKCNSEKDKNLAEVKKMSDYFIREIKNNIIDYLFIGESEKKLPSIINICLPNKNSEFLVIALDEEGVACSAMTTCKSVSDVSRSYVVDEINPECGASSLRFSLSHKTTRLDIKFAVRKLKKILQKS